MQQFYSENNAGDNLAESKDNLSPHQDSFKQTPPKISKLSDDIPAKVDSVAMNDSDSVDFDATDDQEDARNAAVAVASEDFDADDTTDSVPDNLLAPIVTEFIEKILVIVEKRIEEAKLNALNAEFSRMIWNKEKAKRTPLRNDRDHIAKPLSHLQPNFYGEMNITDIFPFFTDEHSLQFFKLFSSIYHQEYSPKYHNYIQKDLPVFIQFLLNQIDKDINLRVSIIWIFVSYVINGKYAKKNSFALVFLPE